MTSSRRSPIAVLFATLCVAGCGDDGPATDTESSTSDMTGTDTTTTMTTTIDPDSSSSVDPDTSTTQTTTTVTDTAESSGGARTDSSGGGTTATDESSSGDPGESSSESTGAMTLPDISGEHLLVLSIPIGPDLPLQYRATVVQTPDGDGALLDFSLQPLSLDPGSTTTPRLPVGDPLVFDDVAVAADGSFTLDIGVLDVAGETNAITSSDASAQDVVLEGQLVDDENWCGTMTGTLTMPLMFDLAGSTFAGIAIDGALPLMFPLGC